MDYTTDLDSYLVFPRKDVPEKNLLNAVFSRAVQDIKHPGYTREIVRWIANDWDDSPFSFNWICEGLDLRPEIARRMLLDPDIQDSIGKYKWNVKCAF